MEFELAARTEAGARLIALAEKLAAGFAENVATHDRDGRYPFEHFEALRAAGYFTAPIPEELGGLGVDSAHDILVASTRLARSDPALTIGVNMHLVTAMNSVRRWRMALNRGDEQRAAALAVLIETISRKGAVIAAAVSEPNQDLTRPSTTATRTENGWVIDGRKIFATMSPAADTLLVSVSYPGRDGEDRYAYAIVPKDTPGVEVHDDWDALGMRASGSNSVSFHGAELPAYAIGGGFPAGGLSVPFMERNLTAGPFHASASLGIAETAHATAVAALRDKPAATRPRAQMLAAENAVELSAIRGAFGRAGMLIDEYYAQHPDRDADLDGMTRLFAEVQSTKVFVQETAVRIVDRALSLSGGAGYMNRHPLSRAYRDVRAGTFMHPLGSNRAYEVIGQVALGLDITPP